MHSSFGNHCKLLRFGVFSCLAVRELWVCGHSLKRNVGLIEHIVMKKIGGTTGYAKGGLRRWMVPTHPSPLARSQGLCLPWFLKFLSTATGNPSAQRCWAMLPRQLYPCLPVDRCTYLHEAWLVFSQLPRNFQEATIPVLLVGRERPRACLVVRAFLPGFPLCRGRLVGRCRSDRCSVGPLLQGPVSHPVLRSLSDAGRVALCKPAHSC